MPLFVAKSFLSFFQARRAGGETAERFCGATLPPAGHRNYNGANPEENPEFLLGFRADDWTEPMTKSRRMPLRTS